MNGLRRPIILLLPVTVGLACFPGIGRADLAPDAPNVDKPDFAVTAIAFKGKTNTTHKFPITTSAAAAATMKLAAAEPVGMQGAACQYEMTFDAINAGPGGYRAANPYDGVGVKVEVKFPDGTSQAYEGKWWCDGAFTQGIDQGPENYETAQAMAAASGGMGYEALSKYVLAAGAGCAIVEPVVLAVGMTRIAWTFDPGNKTPEFSEANNKFAVDLVVGPQCEPTRVSVKPGAGGTMQVPEGATGIAPAPALDTEALRAASGNSRDSLGKAFRFGGNGKAIQRQGARKSSRGGRDP